MNFATGQEKYIFIIKKLSSLFLFIFNDGTGESSYKYTSLPISNSTDLLWRRARNKGDCNTVWNKLQNGRQLAIKIYVRRNRLGNG
jgi:hypothetical protein